MFFFFQAEDGIRDLVRSRGLGDVYKRQEKFYGEPEQEIPLPPGIAIWGGALYWPSQGFPLALSLIHI